MARHKMELVAMALRANKLHRFAALGEHPVERATEYFPEARWQRCMVHFYRNVFSRVPAGKLPEVALMLKIIYAQEDFQAAQRKAAEVVARLLSMRLGKAAELVETAVPETLAYYAFPEEHWRRIRTNNPLERMMREIRRRTRVVGAFPDGNSALNLERDELIPNRKGIPKRVEK